jgi:MurNAc alpha-1-phosphate uridylyltransferase
MLPRTERVPKVLLPVAGRPFAAWLLERLATCGLEDVVMCVAHLGAEVRRFVGDGRAYGVRVRYSDEGSEPMGTGGALVHALPLLSARFLVTYGDSFLPFDYRAPLLELEAAPALEGVMAVFENRGAIEPSNARVEDGRVAVYDKAGVTPGLDFIDYGATALTKGALERIAGSSPPALRRAFGFDLVQAALARAGTLGAHRVDERFFEVGSPEGLSALEGHLAARAGAERPSAEGGSA